MKRLPYARRQQILEILKHDEYIDIHQLSKRLDVSYMTIHRDLEELAKTGEVERIYGGAAKPQEKPAQLQSPACDLTIEERFQKNMDAKNAIASQAAKLISENEIIGIDASTTTLCMCAHIDRMHITVVTNSISVALQLSSSSTVNVILLGGVLRKPALTTVGSMVNDFAKQFSLNRCFISATALSFSQGLTDITPEESETKKGLIASSSSVVVLVDSSKVGQISGYNVCFHDQIHYIISNDRSEMTAEQKACLDAYQAAKVKIISI